MYFHRLRDRELAPTLETVTVPIHGLPVRYVPVLLRLRFLDRTLPQEGKISPNTPAKPDKKSTPRGMSWGKR
jgi:hypothetical protein